MSRPEAAGRTAPFRRGDRDRKQSLCNGNARGGGRAPIVPLSTSLAAMVPSPTGEPDAAPACPWPRDSTMLSCPAAGRFRAGTLRIRAICRPSRPQPAPPASRSGATVSDDHGAAAALGTCRLAPAGAGVFTRAVCPPYLSFSIGPDDPVAADGVSEGNAEEWL